MSIILVADDHETNRKLLSALLKLNGYEVVQATNGAEALQYLLRATHPVVGLIDWEMPEMEGVEVCRQARLRSDAPPLFLLLLTARDDPRDLVTGLSSGANDYVTKPFDQPELLARVKIGVQMVALQQALIHRVQELNNALAQVKQLSGFLPICSYCRKIRDDKNYWTQVEEYITQHSEAKFSHGICPQCFETHVRPELEQMAIDLSNPSGV